MTQPLGVLTLLAALTAALCLPGGGDVEAAPADCQLIEPFAEALGPWTVGQCAADPTTDPDGSRHQETTEGRFSQFSAVERPVFREAARLWTDGPGGIASDVRVVIPASASGERVEVHRRAATVLERAALDEPTMPMGWEALPPPTGRTYPGAACQPAKDDLVLGRVQALFGDERGQVRVLQSVSALRDGSGPEMFGRIREWLAACPEWQTAIGEQQLTYRVTVRPLEPLGEESVRYTVEASQADGRPPTLTDTVVARYGDLLISHGFLLSAPGQIGDGDLVGIVQLTERKPRAGLR